MMHGTRSGYRYHRCRCAECRVWSNRHDQRRAARSADRRRAQVARARRWYATHPEARRRHELRRRAREYAAAGWASAEQIAARVAYYGGCCWICGKPDAETTDHVIPLAAGGSNWPANLRPACKSCNSRKGALYLAGICRRLGTEQLSQTPELHTRDNTNSCIAEEKP